MIITCWRISLVFLIFYNELYKIQLIFNLNFPVREEPSVGGLEANAGDISCLILISSFYKKLWMTSQSVLRT